MNKKYIYFLVLVFLLMPILLIFIRKWDYKEVKLQYLGDVLVEPHLAEVLEKDFLYSMRQSGGWWAGGRTVKQVKAIEWSINDHSEKKINKINWDQLPLRDGENYYLCVGCTIGRLTYYYHTKFTNPYSKSQFKVDDVKLMLDIDRSTIKIYKGDVDVVWVPEINE